jgi:hypothetical protein
VNSRIQSRLEHLSLRCHKNPKDEKRNADYRSKYQASDEINAALASSGLRCGNHSN